MQPASEQLDYLLRGVDRVVPEAELEERLGEGRPLRVKLGIDPTAPDVHLGWAVVFGLLRRFQDLGHTAVLIVGDFTAQVGDPSGTSETRERLEAAAVGQYADALMGTIKELLAPDHLEIRHNSEWLAGMEMTDVLDLAGEFTVARFLDREDFAARYREGKPISLVEFVYPLLQAMDSVAVEADIEIGGTDQLLNLLVGRDLQGRRGQTPQLAMTVPLLVGTDGVRKMSQSFGNYISVRDAPGEMFGKVMSIPDEAMSDYFLLTTDIDETEVEQIKVGLGSGELHPGETKRRLGREIVTKYWGAEAASEAEEGFDRVFRNKLAPSDIPEHPAPTGDPIWLPGALHDAGLVTSNSEGKRLVAQGAVKIDGDAVTSEDVPRVGLIDRIVSVGKRRFVRFVG